MPTSELKLIEQHRSLSLKSNASQDRILFELEQLKYSFKEALRLSLRPIGGRLLCQGDKADARVSMNLHKLAAAAKQFHSAASSTSGTTRDGSNISWRALSLIGDFPEHKQQRVRDFIDHQLHYPAPVSVASGQETAARTVSPRRSHTPILSPLVTNLAVGNMVSAPEPFQVDPDDDEDDETDDEQEYFDGLEELARECMLSRDYAKAIDFLTQAMTRDIGATSTGNEFRELQILLALCHFLHGDWKKAEPIVTSLSRVLDEVTCNLLHALALSHLFEYSLDEALKTCRKSMNGKKKLLKASAAGSNGYPEHDYAETVALFATIYHISGDPIRAEIFHRRLPQGFEYQHPASAVDFVLGHPRVLTVVLGSDTPVSSAGGFGWPSDTRRFFPAGLTGLLTAEHSIGGGLCRKATVAESPLKTRVAFFERYENDTCKIAVEGPSPCSPAVSEIDMDADDERSPAGASSEEGTPHLLEPAHPSRLVPRRRVTRIFTSRQPRHSATDDDSGVGDVASPETPALPASRWNKFGFTKPRTLYRKKSSGNVPDGESPSMAKRTRTLRLGTMELTLKTRSFPSRSPSTTRLEFSSLPSDTSEDITATHYDWRFDPSAEPPRYPSAVVDASLDHSGEGMASGSLSQYSEGELRHRPSPEAHVGPHIEDQLAPITGFFSTSSVTNGGGGVSSSSSRSSQENAMLRIELPVTERPVELHGVALSPIEIINKYISDQWESFRGWSPYEEPTPSTSRTCGAGSKIDRLPGILEEPLQAQDYAARPLVPTTPSQFCVAPMDLAGVLGRVAGIVASLPDAADADKRLAARSKLEAILTLLEGISNDPMLASDLRRIIASLEAGRKEPSSPSDEDKNDVSDSGYETGDQEQEQPVAHSPEQATPAANLDGDLFHAPLRPTPSFVAGDDASFTRREPEESSDGYDKQGRGAGSGRGVAGPAVPDGRVLHALRPYARPRSGMGLDRTFSFTAGVDDGIFLPTRPVS